MIVKRVLNVRGENKMHGPYDDMWDDSPKSEETKRREKAWEKIEAEEKEKAERVEYKRLHRKYGTF